MTRPAQAVVEFFVAGDPAPQGSKSAVVDARGRARLLEGRTSGQRARFGAWRSAVAGEAWAAMAGTRRITPLVGPTAVELEFRMSRPKSAKDTQRWKTTNPDLDKLVRAVLDGLKAGSVIGDDNQVCQLVATKVLAWPDEPTGCAVTVRTVEHTDAPGAARPPPRRRGE